MFQSLVPMLSVVSLHAAADELWKCTRSNGNVTYEKQLLVMHTDPSIDCELLRRSELVPKRLTLTCQGMVRDSYDGVPLPATKATETYSFENGSLDYATCSWSENRISCIYKGTRHHFGFDRISGMVNEFDSGATVVGYHQRHFSGQCEKTVESKF